MKTYAIKWEEKILVTSQNKDTLIWYNFIQEEETELEKYENEKTQIQKELSEVNGFIEWAKKLKEMWAFDEDDELELVLYETKAQELIIKRSEIKIKIKELWN